MASMYLGFGTIDLEPGSGTRLRPSAAVVVAAAVIPIALAACLIPLRDQLVHSAGIILVLPVIGFGIYFGAVPGLVASVSAVIGFDLFLAEPYLHPSIHKSEDVVAGITVLVVGAAVGLLGSRLARLDRRSLERLRELSVLERHADMVTRAPVGSAPPAELIESTAENLIELLQLESCEWEPMTQWDPRTTVGQPTLLDNGQVIGRVEDLPEDRAQLPNPVELVVNGEHRPFGRFVMVPKHFRTSIEERRIAATLCRMTAAHLTTQES